MTQLSFLWLNSNEDISQLQNRSERRYVISENKKRRDEAKKLRNRQFRELIQLIKSSDSRIEKFKNERKVEIERKIAEDQQKVMEERLNDLKIANEYRLKQDEELEEAFGNIQACEYKNLKKNENVEYTFCTACKKSIKASYMPVHITKQVHINNDRSAKKNNKKSKRNRVATDS
ncbi:MAG: DnaJ subfamily C member 21 [Marteilia pararefringens]